MTLAMKHLLSNNCLYTTFGEVIGIIQAIDQIQLSLRLNWKLPNFPHQMYENCEDYVRF